MQLRDLPAFYTSLFQGGITGVKKSVQGNKQLPGKDMCSRRTWELEEEGNCRSRKTELRAALAVLPGGARRIWNVTGSHADVAAGLKRREKVGTLKESAAGGCWPCTNPSRFSGAC